MLGNNILIGAAGAAGADAGHIIEGSGLFDGSTGYLSRTPASNGDERQGTIEFIVKPSEFADTMLAYQARAGGAGTAFWVYITSSYQIRVMCENDGGTAIINHITTPVFRDPSAYYHIVVNFDGDTTGNGCVNIYVNGTQITDFGTRVNLSTATDLNLMNSTKPVTIGFQTGAASYLDGYLSRATYIDGQALDPIDFGSVTDNGFWQINKVEETFAITGANLSAQFETSQPATTSSEVTTHNWTSQDIGTASADRTVIVALGTWAGTASGTTLTSFTIDGVQMNYAGIQQMDITAPTVYIYYLNVPTGTSAAISATWAVKQHSSSIGIWTVDSLVEVHDSKGFGDGSSDSDAISLDLTVPAGGFIVGYHTDHATSTHSWTELTENFDEAMLSNRVHSGASKSYSAAATPTITVDPTGSAESAALVVAFRPVSEGWEFGNNGFLLEGGANVSIGNDTSEGAELTGTWESSAVSTANVSAGGTYTFSSQDIGTAASNRNIIVVASTGGGSAACDFAATCTVGGTSIPRIVDLEGVDNNDISVYQGVIASGTSADIVFTVSGNTMEKCGLAVHVLYGDKVSLNDTYTQAATTAAPSGAVDVVAGGVIIAANKIQGNGTARTTSWTNATEVYDQTIEVNSDPDTHSGTYTSYTSAATVTVTGTASGTTHRNSLVVMSFSTGNNFTKTGTITATSDSPTNDADNEYGNWATLDALYTPKLNFIGGSFYQGTNTYSEGNLRCAASAASGRGEIRSTISLATGHVYAEMKLNAIGNSAAGVGLISIENNVVTNHCVFARKSSSDTTTHMIDGGGDPSAGNDTGGDWTTGNSAGVAVDIDNNSVVIINPNTGGANSAFTPTSSMAGKNIMIVPVKDSHATNRTLDGTMNYGSGATAFVHASSIPTGANDRMVSYQQPTPAIINPEEHFHSVVVTHNGTSTASTCTFNLDTYEWLAIIKNTTGAAEKWYWIDSLRGVTKYISSDSTAASTTDANVMSVSGTTFTLGSTLGAKNYLVEFHKAGLASATASNEEGSLNTTETSANTVSGFAISTYTGTGSNATCGHGLTSAPEFIAIKDISTGSAGWINYHIGMGGTKFIKFDTAQAAQTLATVFQDTNPSATLITMGTANSINTNEKLHVSYAWHSVEGYSSFGSIEGNGNANGAFVNLGFAHGKFFAKGMDASSSWWGYDKQTSPNNPDLGAIWYDNTDPQQSAGRADRVFNGVKFRNANDPNSANTTIYGAWGGRAMTDGAINQGRADGIVPPYDQANGGTIKRVGDFWVHTFNSSGTFTAHEDMVADYLVIAGGGGGGGMRGGGGGAGGYRSSWNSEASGGGGSSETALNLTAGTDYTVTVGAGGAGGAYNNIGGTGNNSIFSSITSNGGGGGNGGSSSAIGGPGGSGGGTSNDFAGGLATTNQGNAGGRGFHDGCWGGGGGGGAGETGVSSNGTTGGGRGGNGVSSTITGSATVRGGGGGGGRHQTCVAGAGGTGGGGAGSNTGTGNAGTANTGGGGGAISYTSSFASQNGGAGGSGVVIIRYAIS